MPTAYTSLLGLALPVTGELDGAWGPVVNDEITTLLDSAVAGTTTLSTDADVTLTTANGAPNQARQMILNCTGSRAAQRTITAPAASKVYVVINGTSGGFGVKLVGAGPTTGVVVPAGRMAVLAWNGSDFVTLGAVVDLTASGNVSVAGTTTLAALNASGNVSFDGGTFVFNEAGADRDARFEGDGDPNLLFLDASTDRVGIGTSDPQFKLDVHGASGLGIRIYETSTGNNNRLQITQDGVVSTYSNTYSTGTGVHAWQIGNAEFMRLDASGNLGLGVVPSAWVAGSTALQLGSLGYTALSQATGGDSNLTSNVYLSAASTWTAINSLGASRYQLDFGAHRWYTAPSGTAGNAISFTQAMTLDASGNLGIGTNTPAAKLDVNGASNLGGNIQTISGSTIFNSTGDLYVRAGTSGALRLGSDGSNDRAVLDSSGNLGIGTSSPAAKLDVASSSFFPSVAFKRIGTGIWYVGGDNVGSTDNFHITLNTSNFVTITSGGNLGIGTSSPVNKLDVLGDVTVGGFYRNADVTAVGTAGMLLNLGARNGSTLTPGAAIGALLDNPATTGVMQFYTRAGGVLTERARITSGGDLLVGTTSGTYRLSAAVDSGADRDILLAGVTGVTNGLHVQWNHATSKTHVRIADIPTSAAGLPAGTLWNDGGTLKIA